jgi:HEAT repeat protein
MRFFPIIAVVGGLALVRGAQAPAPFAVSAVLQQCEESELQVAAINALLQMDTEQAMPILRRVLDRRDDCSVKLRRKAVFVVAQYETEQTEEILLEVVRTDPDLGVREQAVFWLSQVEGDQAVLALDSILNESDESALQEKAIFALSQHESARARELLRDYAARNDAPDALREKAIFWIGNRESGADRAYLQDLYRSVTSQRLKERIIFAVSQHEAMESRDWLLGVAGDAAESIELRKKALFWAAQRNDVDAAGLAALYEGAAERELKEQIVFGLSQRDEPEAVDQLLAIARTESDSELRRKAIFWLGQSNDPRVAEFLLEIIGQGPSQ